MLGILAIVFFLVALAERPPVSSNSGTLRVAVRPHGILVSTLAANHSMRNALSSLQTTEDSAASEKEHHAATDQPASSLLSVAASVRNPEAAEVSPAKGSKRTNLCAKMRAVSESRMKLEDALRGEHLSAAFREGGWNYIHRDNDTGQWKGYGLEVLKASAREGGYKFTLHAPPMNDSRSQQGWIDDNIQSHDILMDLVVETSRVEREHRVYPIYNFVDTSPIVFARQSRDSGINLCKLFWFLAPYSWKVWVFLVLLHIFTGWAYWVVEREANKAEFTVVDEEADSKLQKNSKRFALSAWTGCMHTTTIQSFLPVTWLGRLLVLSWSLHSIFVLETYSSNLAANLVVQKESDMKWTSIEHVIADGARICVRPGSGEQYMKDTFPAYDRVITSEANPAVQVAKGRCEAGIMWKTQYDIALGNQDANPDCSLYQIGGRLSVGMGGWSVFQDWHSSCTAFLGDVLHVIFDRLVELGELEKLYKTVLLKETQTRKSNCNQVVPYGAQSASMGIDAVAGIFLLHFVVALVVLAFFVFSPGISDGEGPSEPEDAAKMESSSEPEGAAATTTTPPQKDDQ
mmetsp:Transcript_111690/g.216310  ORF Transcript_111690/g.216310 Transcript_111690/m.216310 type:complete len:573 (-) Transcript_111690:93-1811(-)